jgi:hypothetical protein
MSRSAVRVVLVCVLCLSAGCASTSEPTQEDKVPAKTEASEPVRPTYHAESDAEKLGYDEAKRVARVVCGAEPAARECRRSVGRSALGYSGAFSAPGADEMVVVADDSTTLLLRENGRWTRVAQLAGTDAESCLVANGGETDSLICRLPVARDDGYATEFYRIYVGEDEPLVKDSLDLPKATDVDAVLFAGWKNGSDGIEVRIHDASKVRSKQQTIDMNASGECKHRTFVYQPNGTTALRELDECTTSETLDQTSSDRSTYEGGLRDPLSGRNRYYAMCYQNEIDRLTKLAEQRKELTEKCEAGAASDDVDCSTYLEDEEGAKAAKAGSETDADAEGAVDEEQDVADPKKLAGTITTRIVIGSTGAPVACEVVESTMNSSRVESCLCREMMKTAFPPVPKGSFFDVTYPFDFSPEYTR